MLSNLSKIYLKWPYQRMAKYCVKCIREDKEPLIKGEERVGLLFKKEWYQLTIKQEGNKYLGSSFK